MLTFGPAFLPALGGGRPHLWKPQESSMPPQARMQRCLGSKAAGGKRKRTGSMGKRNPKKEAPRAAHRDRELEAGPGLQWAIRAAMAS